MPVEVNVVVAENCVLVADKKGETVLVVVLVLTEVDVTVVKLIRVCVVPV